MHDVDPRDIPTLQRYIEKYSRDAIGTSVREIGERLDSVQQTISEHDQKVDRVAKILKEDGQKIAFLQARLNWAEPTWIYHRARKWVMTAMVGGMFAMLLIFFTPVGDLFNAPRFPLPDHSGQSTTDALPANGAVCASAPTCKDDLPPCALAPRCDTGASSGVEAATRNMLTILGPIMIGIAIWIITVVAERRLKAYDETIEGIRDKVNNSQIDLLEGMKAQDDKLTEALNKQLAKVTDDATRILKAEAEELSKKAEEQSAKLKQQAADEARERSLDIDQMRKDMEDRYGSFIDTMPTLDGLPVTSVGDVRKAIAAYFENEETPKAIQLVEALYRAARPFRKGT